VKNAIRLLCLLLGAFFVEQSLQAQEQVQGRTDVYYDCNSQTVYA
jgi:hypothetical protein